MRFIVDVTGRDDLGDDGISMGELLCWVCDCNERETPAVVARLGVSLPFKGPGKRL